MPFEIAPVVYDGIVAAAMPWVMILPRHNLSAERRTQDGVGSSLREKPYPSLLATVLHVADDSGTDIYILPVQELFLGNGAMVAHSVGCGKVVGSSPIFPTGDT